MRRMQVAAGLLLVWLTSGYAAPIQHVEPPSWWIGMQNDRVQLLVHGPGIGERIPSIDHPGVRLLQTNQVDNPNYLFLDLRIDPQAQPGDVALAFTDEGGEALTWQWPLRTREPDSASRRGFGPRDVIYLVTPDRFANGNPENDSITGMREAADRSDPDGRHGGDLQGLINHLDYIDEMGFTQLWLNPVVENDMPHASYHGYAATDFYRVDARLGDNALYRELSEQAAKRGIGIIHDVVLNHIGSLHWWMADLPTTDWVHGNGEFIPTNHRRETRRDPHAAPGDREAFTDGWFVPTMPDLNQRNPLLAQYLIQNTIWWIETAGLSGLRVDTWPYSDREFLDTWTNRVLAEYPALGIVGEEWSINPAVIGHWQRGKANPAGVPSLMDFPLQDALVRALNEPPSWNAGWPRLYETLTNDFQYADPAALVVFPDNHDMSRIYTQLDEDPALYRMALSYLLTTRGIPQLFYGTEILMGNPGTDAHGVIRSDFPGGWQGDAVNASTSEGLSKAQRDAQAFVRKLLQWRSDAPAIHDGELIHYVPADGVYVTFRRHTEQTVMVVMARTEKPVQLPLARFAALIGDHQRAIDVVGGAEYSLAEPLPLPALGALILELR